MGTSVNTIANWENGRVNLWFIETVVKLCKIFKCLPEDLIDCNLNGKDVENVEENNTLGLKEIRKRLGTDEKSFFNQ
jgi:transcriptional regulator with XRE-family HTH domain